MNGSTPRTLDHTFSQVDVFSTTPYMGNPLAVVGQADALTDEQMQRIARWTNLSETAFLLSPSSEEADYRVRVFTPGGEMAFAGGPTLGAAHAWLEDGGDLRYDRTVVQECAVGLVTVRSLDGTLAFEAPPTLRSGDLEPEHLARVATALRIPAERVTASQWVDNGPGWAVVRLNTAAEVLQLDPDFSHLPDAMIGVIGSHPPGSPHAYETRAFAPALDVFEDPICGSVNASIGQWLARIGQAAPRYRVSQGARTGRAGELVITARDDGSVWVGGATTTLFWGTATLTADQPAHC